MFVLLAAGVCGADQITKALAASLVPAGSRWPLVGGWVQVSVVRNPGASFGLGAGFTPLITTVAALVTAGCLLAGWRTRTTGWAIALGLITGGAAGNLTDRLFRPPGPWRGAVLDWIHVPFYGPVFNLADLALRAGALLAVILWLRPTKPHPRDGG